MLRETAYNTRALRLTSSAGRFDADERGLIEVYKERCGDRNRINTQAVEFDEYYVWGYSLLSLKLPPVTRRFLAPVKRIHSRM